jgi:predicted CopG family antitoxin
MARKTIRINLEAYERLKNHKKPSESFSQTIKRVVRPPFDVDA